MHAENDPPDIRIIHGLRPEHRTQAAAGYWRAFSRKLRYPLGPQTKAITFLERVLDPTHAISATTSNGTFLGVAGFKTDKGSFVGGGFRDLAAIYGWIGASLRAMMVSLLERTSTPDTLLMDGIFVEPDARGLGVGTGLLHAIMRHAEAAGYSNVRLDVIDTNPRAQALYERMGFRAQSVQSLGPFKHVFGFSQATEMVKPVGRPVM